MAYRMITAHTLACIAGTVCTFGFLPLLWNVWRGQCQRLPIFFLLAYALGIALWLVYGVRTRSALLMTLGVLQFVQLATVIALGFLSRTPHTHKARHKQ